MINIKALLCIHGLLSNCGDFDYIKKEIYPFYDEVICFDVPGHGNNSKSFSSKNIKQYILDIYDKTSKKYNEIDVIGYSMGGIIACYLQSVRKINKLMLLAPAYRYLNFKNLNPKKIFETKKNISIDAKKIKYSILFPKIVFDLSYNIMKIKCDTIIIWGRDDFMVKESSGKDLYKKCISKNKQYHVLNNLDHSSILKSPHVVNLLVSFLRK